MKLLAAVMLLAGSAPFLPGELITFEHGEGLIAGDAVRNDDGYWMTRYAFGPVGASPVDEARTAVIRDMLAGKRLKKPVLNNMCSGGFCTAARVYKIDWRSKCDVRDLYAYRNMDAIRIEWECDGSNDGFNIVDFKNGVPTQVRDFGPDKLIWIKEKK